VADKGLFSQLKKFLNSLAGLTVSPCLFCSYGGSPRAKQRILLANLLRSEEMACMATNTHG
jgi:hypothetical protein